MYAKIVEYALLILTLVGVVLLILAFDKLDERRMVLIMMMVGIFAFMYAFRRGIRLKAEQFAASKQDSIEEEKEEE